MTDILFSKESFSTIAILLTFAAFYPYFKGMFQGVTRPHAFSWIIWAFGTVIVFIAQLSDGAGIGAWPIGLSGLLTFGVAGLAYLKQGDRRFVRSDWIFLVLAASALPLWFVTNTALSAVLVLTLVDLLGFGPTVRKAYHLPYEENAALFAIGALRNGFVILALEHYSWTTVLFPAAVGMACVLFVFVIFARRTASPRA